MVVRAGRLVVAQALGKMGDRAVDARTVLPAMLVGAGAPAWMGALLVAVRESGSLLLQPLVAPWLRGRRASPAYRVGAAGQALCAAGMGVAALTLAGVWLGLVVLALLALFALARSLSSLASKQILAEVADGDRRGSLNGAAASAGGLITLVLAGLGVLTLVDNPSSALIGPLLLAGGACWLLALGIVPASRAQPSTDGEQSAGLAAAIELLRSDRVLRRFVYSRGLLLGGSLAGPYLLLLASQRNGVDAGQLSAFILAGAAASLLAGAIWGRWADHSSRQVMVASGLACALLLIALAAASWLTRLSDWPGWLLPAAYALLALTHEGMRVGRKTYIVNRPPATERVAQVAASNGAIGVLLLVVGAIAAPAAAPALSWVLAGLGLLTLTGAVSGLMLPEADE